MNEPYTLILLEDDDSLIQLLDMILSDEGYRIMKTNSGHQALKWVQTEPIDLIIQDIKMRKMNGLTFLERLNELDTRPPSIVMTAFSTWDHALQAMRLGAYDFIKKPFDTDMIRTVVRRALEYKTQTAAFQDKGVTGFMSIADIIGSSDQMAYVFDLVRRVAKTDSTALIYGESGTGKELIARAIHFGSSRASEPFIPINCAAFSESLLESELFGHVKGAFTGAYENRKGMFEIANRGTLFLDEVGEMSLQMQVKLLRVLETREFTPVGGAKPKHVDVRFITATNRVLEDMVRDGSFREDLYYRLNVIPIVLPPLSGRREDIPLLAGHFISKFSRRMNRNIKGISDTALRMLISAEWPGNVRELENTIERAVALCAGDEIRENDIKIGRAMLKPGRSSDSSTDDVILPENGLNLQERLEEIESQYIQQALGRTNGNLTEAAKLLGMTFRSIRYRVKKLGIDKKTEYPSS